MNDPQRQPEPCGDQCQHRALRDGVEAIATVLRDIVQRLPDDPDALLTTEQLAELLQLSARTLKDQACAGVIPHHRFGKHYRFSRDDIKEILRISQFEVPPRARRLRSVA